MNVNGSFFFCMKAYFSYVFCIVSMTPVPDTWIFFSEDASMPQAVEGQLMASIHNFIIETEQRTAPQILDVRFKHHWFAIG